MRDDRRRSNIAPRVLPSAMPGPDVDSSPAAMGPRRGLRTALLGGVSLLALVGFALSGRPARAACVDQVITANQSSEVVSNGCGITITNGFSVTVPGGTAIGVVSPFSATTINNLGGATGQTGVTVGGGLSVDLLSNSGTISGASNAGAGAGVSNNGSIGTLTNTASGPTIGIIIGSLMG